MLHKRVGLDGRVVPVEEGRAAFLKVLDGVSCLLLQLIGAVGDESRLHTDAEAHERKGSSRPERVVEVGRREGDCDQKFSDGVEGEAVRRTPTGVWEKESPATCT